jgi:xanthine permease XanP
LGVDSILAIPPGGALAWYPGPAVGGATLLVMAGVSVWAKGQIGTLGAVAGLAFGFVASLATGMIDPAAEARLIAAPALRLPDFVINLPHWDANLLLLGIATGLAITLNSVGALTAAQRLNDADWKRQDLRNLSRGLYADALGSSATALLGGSGVAASAGAVGLAASSRVTSRSVGYAVAAGYILLSLSPKFALLVLSVPRPVLGASLIFLSCALLISGVSIISSRLLDARKTFTLGIAFAAAAATPSIVAASAAMPIWMAPVTASPVLSSALIALLLNPLLRLGVRQQVQLVLPAEGLPSQEVSDFIARAGAGWGARREIVLQVQSAILQCLETLTDAGLAQGERRLRLSFDELRLDARVSWRGRRFPLGAARPTAEQLLMDDEATTQMASYLIGRLASRVSSNANGEQAELLLQFDH